MGFHDVLFPTNMSAGSGFGPGFNTSVVVLGSGAEQRVARWAAAKRRFNAAFSVRKPADLYSIIEFYIARVGPANSFRVKDWSDYATTSSGSTHNPLDNATTNADVQIGTGDGTEVDFQLFKQYVSGSQTVNRNVYLPVAGSVKIAINAVDQTDGVDFTFNTTTGLVTFTVAPVNTLPITAGFEFDVKARFGKEVDLSMPVNLGEFNIGDIPDIPIVEVREENPDPEMAWHGGSAPALTTAANYSVTLAEGRMHRVTPTANIEVTLPNEVLIEAGGPIFAFDNQSGTFTVELLYEDGSSIEVIPVSTFREVWLVLAAGDLKEWQTK
tara:strand:- start:37182 stop:38159 length:978 start_codon:yes stop_codon:yes gene_type:complete